VSVVKLVLGVLLLLRQWRGRPRGDDEPPAPKWMGAIEQFTPAKALVAGAVLVAANPKNGLLAIDAAASIAATPTDPPARGARSTRAWRNQRAAPAASARHPRRLRLRASA
jgi:Sap, sulfolipid-1-addressing protein